MRTIRRSIGTIGLVAGLALGLGAAPALAAPSTPTVTPNGSGSLKISGTGSNWWHVALQPAGGGTTSYLYPDLASSQTLYTPPTATPCISVQGRAGGDSGGNGTTASSGFSGYVCATYATGQFPNAPTVTNNADGTVKIAGTGSSFWHLALKATATSSTTTYSYPDIAALQSAYAPPAATPCVSVESVRGGTGYGDGQAGNWSGFTCATGTTPAAPAAPKVYDNANGTLTFIGRGDSYWHVALQATGGGTTTYVYGDQPASLPVYATPPATPCASVEAQTGGTGFGDGTLGSWSGYTCATGSTAFPNVSTTLTDNGATVRALSTSATKLRFTAATSASGAGALSSQDIVPTNGVATYRPPPDHPYVDVVPLFVDEQGTRLRDERGGALVKTSPPPPNRNTIVGTAAADGYGPTQAAAVLAGHVTWARTEPSQSSVAQLHGEHFKVLQIVGNTPDGTPLSSIDVNGYGSSVAADAKPAAGDTGAELLEAGNEMYLKGGACNPAAYAHLYMKGEAALRSAGIKTPYLFNLIGSQNGCNQNTSTEWLQGALNAEPGLAAKILANGVTMHPYGVKDENNDDSGGTLAVNAQENILRNKLGSVPPVYLTEFGFNTCGTHGYSWEVAPNSGTSSPAADAINASFPVLLADPYVKGIWYFQSHDYSPTDCWGFQNNDGTMRPQFTPLSAFAEQQGQ